MNLTLMIQGIIFREQTGAPPFPPTFPTPPSAPPFPPSLLCPSPPVSLPPACIWVLDKGTVRKSEP
jgi:hypothetical protein